MLLALGLMLPAITILGTPGPAVALSGRRTCQYSRVVSRMPDLSTGTERTALLNYKKDGACPYVNVDKFKSITGLDLQGPQPVHKIKCEEALALIRYNPWISGDICASMIRDDIIVFTYDPTTKQTTWVDFGNARTSLFA